MPRPIQFATAGQLRAEINARNRERAERGGLAHVVSYGKGQVVLYEENGESHGNFLPASYRAILGNPAWKKRLRKVHTSARTCVPYSAANSRRELDSCCSSDALLMNIFCYPRLLSRPSLLALVGIEAGQKPEFGFHPRVPLTSGHVERTEIDMRLGDLLVEAKLTENDFQRCPKERAHGYRDFGEVFDADLLPQSAQQYFCYQLIRGTLAAHALRLRYCLLCDERRSDLREMFWRVLHAIRPLELRQRCQLLTWQELAAALPATLRRWLRPKYGIESAND